MTDKELNKLAEDIYKSHKELFDFVNKYKTDIEIGNLKISKEQYHIFWPELKQKIESVSDIRLKNPVGNYFRIPTGISGVHFEWFFQGRGRNTFGVELHFESSNKDNNLGNFNILAPYLLKLEKQINKTVDLQPNWGNANARFYFNSGQSNIDNKLMDFAINTMVEMYNYFKPIIDKEKTNFK